MGEKKCSMGHRRRARECALQLLYELEFHEHEVDEVLADYWQNHRINEEVKEYTEWLVRGVVSRLSAIDAAIQSVSTNWRLDRMAMVDRNIIRLAVFELEAEAHLAPAIVINEAVEIAKKFSGEEAAHFINGILDAIRKRKEKEGWIGENIPENKGKGLNKKEKSKEKKRE